MRNIKLTKINDSVLTEQEMSNIRGGKTMATTNCSCACRYANSGGSSTSANGNANNAGGLSSPGTMCLGSMDAEPASMRAKVIEIIVKKI